MTEASVWNFFDRCPEDKKRAKCRFCHNILSCSTSYNLKSHLKLKHNDQVEVILGVSKKRVSNNTRNIVWKHFTPIENEDKVASCNSCNKSLSYRSTVTNLKTHLEKVHTDILRDDEGASINIKDEVDEEVYLEVSDGENSNDSTTTLWGYFKEVNEMQMQCLLCRAAVPRSGDHVRRHMREKHAKIDLEATDIEDGEIEQTEDNDVFSEVIYLDENDQPLSTVKRKSKSANRRKRKIQINQGRSSTSSDEVLAAQRASFSDVVKKSRSENDGDELEKFGNYVTSLLRTVPSNICIKLQMDIVNLIMTQKLEASVQEERQIEAVQTVNRNENGSSVIKEHSSLSQDDNNEFCT